MVHGPWQRPHCWNEITPLLRDAGGQSLAIDLRGSLLPEQQSLGEYVARIVDVLNALTEPVILVGHSMAGAFISQAAEQVPEKVAQLVYVAAYVPANGQSVSDMDRYSQSSFVKYQRISLDNTYSTLLPNAQGTLFADCPVKIATALMAERVAEPTRPLQEPIHVTSERFGKVPRVYIETTRDQVLSLAAQRQMRNNWPYEKVITMETGHFPFVAKPKEFTNHLMEIAEKNSNSA